MVGNGELDLRLGIFAEFIHRFLPRKTLDFCGLQNGAELIELLSKGRARREVVRQLDEIWDTRCAENGGDFGKACVHPHQVRRQAIREEANRQALWEGLMTGVIDMVVSDHSPSPPELKLGDYDKAWGGIASLELGLSIMATIHDSFIDLARWMCEAPARL